MCGSVGQISISDSTVLHRPSAVKILKPGLLQGGVVVACPHSGRFYPEELLSASVLDQFALRRSEDAFVDTLFEDAPKHGATLLVNNFARAFVDVNRSPSEMDPKLIGEIVAASSGIESDRVKAGLGVIPRTVGDNISIYRKGLTLCEAQSRLAEIHFPWHGALESSLLENASRNGASILIDCHSMPSTASGEPSCDIVLGDRFGASCAPVITNEALAFLKSHGLNVNRNNPYAGGYSTIRHGQPHLHHHALQIEVNRGLYMVEGALKLKPAAQRIRQIMSGLVSHLIGVSKRLR